MSDRNVKCNRCKCYRTAEDFIKEGRKMKTCIVCRDRQNKERLQSKCVHKRQKQHCKECDGSQICEHKRRKYLCKECGGIGICKHNRQKDECKLCSDPIKVTINQWLGHSKFSDKKYNRYDADRFIDKCFLKELVKEYHNCYYCKVEMQYIDYEDTLATIERLDNSIGHIKSNCVLCCRKCNFSRH